MGSPKCILQQPSKQTKPRGKYSLKECEIYLTLKKLLSFGFRMLFVLTGIGLLAQLCKVCNICDKIMWVPEKMTSLNFVKSWNSPWTLDPVWTMKHGLFLKTIEMTTKLYWWSLLKHCTITSFPWSKTLSQTKAISM